MVSPSGDGGLQFRFASCGRVPRGKGKSGDIPSGGVVPGGAAAPECFQAKEDRSISLILCRNAIFAISDLLNLQSPSSE